MARADHSDQLLEAERRLREGVRVAEGLAAGDADGGSGAGELLLDANAACRREWEAGAAARRSLAMLLCQAGRHAEAAPHLEALDFTHRLAGQVGGGRLVWGLRAGAGAGVGIGQRGPAPDPELTLRVVGSSKGGPAHAVT